MGFPEITFLLLAHWGALATSPEHSSPGPESQGEDLPAVIEGQALEGGPGRTSPATPPPGSGPGLQAPGRSGEDKAAPAETGAGLSGAQETADRAAAAVEDTSPLAQGKQALVGEVLGKLEEDTLDPLEGIRLMVGVRGADSLDALCGIYNRLAGIERQRRRARRRGARRSVDAVELPAPEQAPQQADIRYTLDAAQGLDAEAVEDGIRQRLDQKYHRFVKQAVNNMEFGRGKRTTKYPGLWHVSAGVPGVGSCSVFYRLDEAQARIRIVGVGHHVGRAAYELDYAVEELARVGRTLSLAPAPVRTMPKTKQAQAAAAPVPEHGLAPAVTAPVKAELNFRENNLFISCVGNDIHRFRRLLSHGDTDINFGGKPGTLLVCAACLGRVSFVRELLSMRGIDVNLADPLGHTPLFFAVQERHMEVIRLLLAAPGINVNLTTKDGSSPLYYAAQQGFTEVVRLLLAAPGIDINGSLLEEGSAPLTVAAELGRKGVVRLLLGMPNIAVDVKSGSLQGTPLLGAAQNNHAGIVALLLERGADVNSLTNAGGSVLTNAAVRGHTEVVKTLLRAREVNIAHTTASGLTALFAAVSGGHGDIVRLLLGKGADSNVAHKPGITPLHAACMRRHAGIVEMLLHAGADPGAILAVSETIKLSPYDIAQLVGDPQIIALFEGHRTTLPEQAPGKDGPGQTPGTTASPQPAAAPDTQPEQPGLTLPGASSGRPRQETDPAGQATAGAEVASPLGQGKQALIGEVLGKLDDDTLDPLEGIRLLIDVRGADSLDALCGTYNRLAGIERQRRRARRRGAWRSVYAAELPAPEQAPQQADIRYTLDAAQGLDAEAVEDGIRQRLDRKYHRFVKQAVNNMEFGRGKRTTKYPGLWHVSAGVPGVGSCSVFYHLDEAQARIRIVGVGHHAGRAAYELDYAVEELARVGRTLSLAPAPVQMMPKKKKKQAGAAAQEAETYPEGQEAAAALAQAETGAGLGASALPQPASPPAPGEAGESGGTSGKKKKKTRVQVALNTLRSEGVEAFGAYIEAVIGEPELLHNLRWRVIRAEDLGAVKSTALEIIDGRIRMLDPEHASVRAQAVPGERVLEKAVAAPVKADLTLREKELLLACSRGDLGLFRRLTRHVTVDFNLSGDVGTPLCLAAVLGHADLVKELLSKPGIDVNLGQYNRCTPLHFAVQAGHVRIVEMLLAAPGINVNLVTSGDTTPLFAGALEGRTEIVRLLLKVPGIEINARKKNGSTALFAATQENHVKIVDMLVKSGADVNLTINDRNPLLCVASKNDSSEIVRILLQAPGVNVNQTVISGETALGIAALRRNKGIVRMLLRNGADTGIANANGLTPIHAACLGGDTAVARMLLEAGADIDLSIRPDTGKCKLTPYVIAMLCGHHELMTLLALHGGPLESHFERLSPGSSSRGTAQEPGGNVPAPVSPASGHAGLTGALPEPPADTLPGAATPAADTTPLGEGREALVREVLAKLDQDTLDPLEGIRLIIDVRGTDSLDALCGIYNRLAGIERQRRRARSRGVRREAMTMRAAAAEPDQADIRYTLGPAADLDAEAVEVAIRKHLDQKYHRFVKQAVNNMEFGRGKRTTGYPGLWHVSAGVPGVGSCSVFYRLDEARARVRIVGVGHHVGRAAYDLDYAVEELAGVGRMLSLVRASAPVQMMPKKRKKQPGLAAQETGKQQAESGETGVTDRTDKRATLAAGAEAETGTETAAATPVPGDAGEMAGAAGKQKKKSRVQVALNTLRSEGLEAFKAYIESEVGEADLLRTLAERVGRAGDLGGIRADALGVVAAHRRLLDPAASPGEGRVGEMPGLVAAAQGQRGESPAIAPARPALNRRELGLIDACAKGDVGKFRRLFRHGNVDVNMSNGHGTFAYYAAFHGHAGILSELLSMPGIDVNLAQDQGYTPLQAAAEHGHVDVLRLLLGARRINVNLLDPYGATPLVMAASQGNGEAVKLLLAAPGIDVNTCLPDGTTALYYAAQYGHEEMVKLLLGHPDIGINARRDSGGTAISIAAQTGYVRTVELLVKSGADVNLPLYIGATPLNIAIDSGHIEIARLLLQAPGMQVNIKGIEGITALAHSSCRGQKDLVRLLLRKGADPNIANDIGVAPLHLACLYGHLAVVQVLLHASADMDAEVKDAQTYTPYDLAELGGHREVMSVLAAHRRRRKKPAGLSPEPGPECPTLTATPPPQGSTPPATTPDAQPGGTAFASTVPPDSPGAGAKAGMLPVITAAEPSLPALPDRQRTQAEAQPPLARAKDALRKEALRKLEQDNLEPLEGIRFLVDVNASPDLDSLCALYNRLARIERVKERARRQGQRRARLVLAHGQTAPAGTVAPVYTLGEKTGLDADTVEDAIKGHLGQHYHRFVKQAVNNMEFGRGKRTTGYPGLWHVSAGVPGVGSCSVFYRLDEARARVRIVGVGHHVGRAAYDLDYAVEELAGVRRTLCIGMMQ